MVTKKCGLPNAKVSNFILLPQQKLQKGDTVGIVAPSRPVASASLQARFDKGISFLENEWGLKVKVAPHCFKAHYYSADKADVRAEEFNALWADPEVKAVMMALGGHTACHILDKLDYEMMAKTPKIFCGISDGTTLLNAIHVRTAMPTFHGPDLCYCFGGDQPPAFLEQIKNCFFGAPCDPVPTLAPWKQIRGGQARGALIGGHSRILLYLLASPYLSAEDFDGKILFLEGTDIVSRLDTQLSYLKLHGGFDRIAGLVLGHFEGSEMEKEAEQRSVADVVLEHTGHLDFPIMEIGELGHCVPNFAFPIGVEAALDADEKKLRFTGCITA